MSRPEHQAPPELYYDETEASKYHSNTRNIKIQEELTNRALELLNLPSEQECLLLDIGCGSGLSGMAIEEAGHTWIGLDISKHMLEIAADRDRDGDLCLSDMGTGLPFRSGVFDGAISISAVQWLCYSSQKEQTARTRLNRFFSSLYTSLKRGSRAVLQLYPENAEQLELISGVAMKNGFSGGVVIDYPNSTKAKKYYLCLFAGYAESQTLPRGLGTEGASSTATFEARRQKQKSKSNRRVGIKDRDWIANKKEQQRRKGKAVKADSKYTGRRRPTAF